MKNNKDVKYQKALSYIKNFARTHRLPVIVCSDSTKSTYGCNHRTMTRKGKEHSHFIEYEPTSNEWKKIMSHRNFKGFDKINSIEICTLCGAIKVENK